MAYEWSKDEYDRLPQRVQDARALLERWFNAMQSGEVVAWMPDPTYPTPIAMEVADAVVERLEREFDHDLRAWASQEAAGSYDAGPGFDRLLPPQRLALVQQLHALKRKHQQPTPPQVVEFNATMYATQPDYWVS